MRCVYVCLLWRLPVANFGRQKLTVTQLCTFDCCFRMAEPGRTVMGGCYRRWGKPCWGGGFEGGSRVIYRSLYVGLSGIGHNFKEAIFLTSTSKSRVITTSTILRQLILHYEDSVHDPQTLVSLQSWRSQLFYMLLVRGVTLTSLLIK